MGIVLKLRKFRVITPAVLVLALFMFSAVALAYLATDHNTVKSSLSTPVKQDSKPAVQGVVSTPATDQTDPCTKTVTESTTNTGTNATNVKETNINCNLQSDGGNSSINVTNSTNQSATSGDSTGQSGSATNTDSTNIDIDL